MHALWHDIGLHRGQSLLLRSLWEEEGLTQTELAERLYRSPATVTTMLQRMEKAGFIERRSDPRDERVSRVYVTEAGRAIRDQVERVWREDQACALAGFSEAELTDLSAYLTRIRDNLLADQPSGVQLPFGSK